MHQHLTYIFQLEKSNFMQINRKYYQRKDSASYLHILQHGCIILVILSKDLFKIYDPLVSVQGQFNLKFTTLSSQYKVKIKNNDPLVLVQGQFNPKFTTLSSQYKVKMKNNDPLVSAQGQFNPKFTTLSSQYKVKMKNNNPLVLVQGQFKKKIKNKNKN